LCCTAARLAIVLHTSINLLKSAIYKSLVCSKSRFPTMTNAKKKKKKKSAKKAKIKHDTTAGA
jgi:hypothetical protein